jgi:hypothetical protein
MPKKLPNCADGYCGGCPACLSLAGISTDDGPTDADLEDRAARQIDAEADR